MSNENASDPRATLVRTKYFSLRPKPLERWLWQQGLPQTAERVFWLHWEEGMRSGDWCSEVPIKRVASECSVDPSTVTRAYQVLKTKGLIRRQDPGRDAANPFQQATAITEVRLPREFLVELGRSPNRMARESAPARALQKRDQPGNRGEPVASAGTPTVAAGPPEAITPSTRRPSREETQAMWGRASVGEKRRFYEAGRDRASTMIFDANSQLTASDQRNIATLLEQTAKARPAVSERPMAAPAANPIKPRRLTALEIAQARSRLLQLLPSGTVTDLLRQIVWATEEGALSRFPPSLAVNIALKKIRLGLWTKPNRMPPQWSRVQPYVAGAETCSAA